MLRPATAWEKLSVRGRSQQRRNEIIGAARWLRS